MQPKDVYRPVFIAGSDCAQGEAPKPATAVPSVIPPSATQPPELPRLHVNVAAAPQAQLPGQVASSFPQQGVMFPDIAVFGQLDQAVPRMALLHPLHMQHPDPGNTPSTTPAPERRTPASANNGGSGKSRSQSDYASRHQAAEQRRRTRINERLERLRTIVPHAERTNTATFLEQVFGHIEDLNAMVAELKEAVAMRDVRIRELVAGECAKGGEKGEGGDNNGKEQSEGVKEEDGRGGSGGVEGQQNVNVGGGGGGSGTGAGTGTGEQWIGMKDDLKRGAIEGGQEPVKRMKTEA